MFENRVTTLKLGLVTYNIARDWDLDTLLSNCEKSGFEGLELRTTHAHGVEISLSPGQRHDTRKLFSDSAVELWGLGSVCEFHSTNVSELENEIETCKRWCELAKDLGATGVKVRPNCFPEGRSHEETINQIGRALHECGKAAADNGVEIWLEVHGNETQHPPQIAKMLAIANHSSVGVCWNSNQSDVVGGSCSQYYQLLEQHIKSCHIVNLWDSRYPYRELFSLLKSQGFSRYTLCEVGTAMLPETGLVFMQCYAGLWRELMGA